MRKVLEKIELEFKLEESGNFDYSKWSSRLREGSIKWETQLSLSLSKILKKIQHLAFTDKIKTIKSYVPEKVKVFTEKNLDEELKYFQKKYSIKIEILAQENLIIPEYKIELLNKSKKILNKIEFIKDVVGTKKIAKTNIKERKNKKDQKKIKKSKKLRTLWVRKKKKS